MSEAPPPLPIKAFAPNNGKSWDASPLPAVTPTPPPFLALSSSSSPPPPPQTQSTAAAVAGNKPASSSSSRSRAKLDPKKFADEKFVSFEFFPPRTNEGTANLMKRIENMGKLKPLFVDITTSPNKRIESLEICAEALMFCGVNVMLHVVCTQETKANLLDLLTLAKSKGIRNLMVIKGDTKATPEVQQDTSTTEEADFPHACDMIAFVRDNFQDSFCIACACYPEGGSNVGSTYEEDLNALVAKQQAGADFCLTQLFFDPKVYFDFVRDCRAHGVTIPIIPGIMPIQLFKVFDRTVKYLGTKVPQDIWDELRPIQHDDAAVREYGINLAVEMSRELFNGGAPGVHLFTLNLERSVSTVVERLRPHHHPHSHHHDRELPWKQSVHDKRANEDVRPIFWSNKPNSYIARTQAWDEFPNGRWGDSSSPAYGELNKGGSHFYSTSVGGSIAERKMAWGASPLSVQELADVFVRFMRGEIDFLPWSETTPGLALETGEISQTLLDLNKNGFLTINSQPRVNAAPSNHATYGWGPNNGIVYQKAYVEFFVCEQGVRALLSAMESGEFPTLAFHACNFKGEELRYNGGEGPCAVTWGVFPHREILQPTIVDPVSFRAWKDEAFELWIQAWADIYNEDSASYNLIWDVHDSFWLVNIVDNDFIQGDIFKIFKLDKVQQAARAGLELKAE